MKKSTLTIILFVFNFFAFGQTGSIEIIKDARIDALVRKQGTVVPPATSPQIPGFRVQLFFDSDRKLIDDARSKFISSYPKIDSYIIYNAPYYVLKVGDFRTLLEAERIKETLYKDFPTSNIIKELINLPRIDQD